MDTVQSIDLITTNPNVRDGRPCLAGTGLEVSVLAIARIVHNQTPEQIAADYDISLAQVHAALSYYYAHRDEIDSRIRQRRELAGELKEQLIPSGHTPLLGRKSQP
ncbi:MAG: DUF433 domain-containing protein [Anaerolineae bacterium]|nr:DUF433 domain-containing protein [Anaerolineae bacterium]